MKSEEMLGKGWKYLGDVDALGYGGKWYREVSFPEENRHGLWQFIELTNMDEACGRDNEGRPTYVVELSEVNLREADVLAAMRSCGAGSVPICTTCGGRTNDDFSRIPAVTVHVNTADAAQRDEDHPVKRGYREATPEEVNAHTDEEKAEACHSYGARCPMGSWEGSNARKLLAEAKREAKALDPRNGANILRGMKLQMPVNKLGSTAAEFGRGDFVSAMVRGVKAGDKSATLVAKMHGINPEDITGKKEG